MTSNSFSSGGATPGQLFALKGEARRLRAQARESGLELSQSAALERVAHGHGFRDWNALSAHVAQGGELVQAASRFPWQDIESPLPSLPVRFVQVSERATHADVMELLRVARQFELIAEKVPEADRREMVELASARLPYTLERNWVRWPDGLFHLCDRGYEPFKGIALSEDQMNALGLAAWNDAYGQHGGSDAFTVLGATVQLTYRADLLKQAARLLASIALEADKTERARGLMPA